MSAISGPKNVSIFSGPTPSNAPRNDVAPLKTITYRAIKTTGTLIVSNTLHEQKEEEKENEKWGVRLGGGGADSRKGGLERVNHGAPAPACCA